MSSKGGQHYAQLLITSVSYLASASLQASAISGSDPHKAAMTFGGAVASAAGGAFLSHFLAKKQEAANEQLAQRNHHVRRGMAEALRDALRTAKTRFPGLPADFYEDLYKSWLERLEFAIEPKNQESLESLFPVSLSEEQFRLLVRYPRDHESEHELKRETRWLDEDQQRYQQNNLDDELALADLLRERLTFDLPTLETGISILTTLHDRWTPSLAQEFAAKLLPLYRNAFAVIFSKGGAPANAIEYKGQTLTLDFLERISGFLARLSDQIQQGFVEQATKGDANKNEILEAGFANKNEILEAIRSQRDRIAGKAFTGQDKYRMEESLDQTQLNLIAELDNPDTTPLYRRDIGAALNDGNGGDPRAGVGVFAGYPDIYWCCTPANREVELSVKVGSRTYPLTFRLNEYLISKYAVTCAQFSAFVKSDDGYSNADWWHGQPRSTNARKPSQSGDDNCPQTSVSWCEASAFCEWLSAKLSKGLLSSGSFDGRWDIRLPYEWEWQHAAMGVASKPYPWGNDWKANYANTAESELHGAIAVGMFPQGRAACGALDMIGNVHEWCANEYSALDAASPLDILNAQCSVRGGSWSADFSKATCMFRDRRLSIRKSSSSIGFRVVCVRAR